MGTMHTPKSMKHKIQIYLNTQLLETSKFKPTCHFLRSSIQEINFCILYRNLGCVICILCYIFFLNMCKYAYHLSSVYILYPGFSSASHLQDQDYQTQFVQTVLQTQDRSEEEKSANCELESHTVREQHTSGGPSILKRVVNICI